MYLTLCTKMTSPGLCPGEVILTLITGITGIKNFQGSYTGTAFTVGQSTQSMGDGQTAATIQALQAMLRALGVE